jgi:branched-chain amino acid transport system substrate-binding protein
MITIDSLECVRMRRFRKEDSMKSLKCRKLHTGQILAGILIVFMVLAAICIDIATAADEIRIGYTPSLTGTRAGQGAHELKAILLALKQINAAGGVNGKKINLIIVDNQSTIPGALAAVQKAVEQEQVLALISFIISAQVLPTSDAIKNYGIPTFVGGTNVAITRRGNPWLFRVRPDDSIAARAMVKYIDEDMKLRKIGILHDSDTFGVDGADLVEQAAKGRGMAIVGREKHASGETDYTAQLLSLKDAGAEVMVVYSHEKDAAWIQRQYRQLGSPYKYLGSPGSQMKSTLDLSKEAAEGLLAIADFVPGQSEANKKYAEAYKKEYNEEFDATSAWVYDALNIVVATIKTAGEDRARIREAILALKGFQGVLGTFSFTPNGDGLHEVSIIQIEQGKPKLLKSVSVEAK